MTDVDKLKLHLRNLIQKEQHDVVLNASWLLNILQDEKLSSEQETVDEVDLDGGQF